MNKIKIKPSNEILSSWIKKFLPQNDVWFFNEKPKFNNINILNIKDYLNNFSSLEYINAYCHWLVRKTAKYVIVENSNWILSLKEKDRMFVYEQQILTERGMILDAESIDHFDNRLSKALYKDKIVISNSIFNSLSLELKNILVYNYAKECDDWNTYEFSLPNNRHLKEISNTFVENDGCNCLATTLYAMTQDKKYLNDWIEEKEFNDILGKYMYTNSNDSLLYYGDVLVFVDKEDKVVHACFCIGNNLFINKSGQSKYNPITIKKFEEIADDWNGLIFYKLRKERSVNNG